MAAATHDGTSDAGLAAAVARQDGRALAEI
jgi:hypothetical protein